MRRSSLAVLATVAALAWTSHASAEPSPTERALAQTLFDEGRTLMGEHKYGEACAKFVKSQELDPSAGTYINLALCHESEGKLATAWAEFNEALSQALRDKRSDREQSAREHIDALKPRLNQLTVKVEGASKASGLVLKLDGVALRDSLWGVPMPVDPGSHALVASAPGKRDWTTQVSFDAPGAVQTIELPPLEAGDAVVGPTAPPSPGLSRRTVGFIVGGAGVVALGVGAVFGLQAFSKNSDSEKECTGGVCNAKGLSLADDATSAAWVSNIAVLLGLAGVGVGVYFIVTPSPAAPKTAAASLRLRATPIVSDRVGGLALQGVF